MAMRTLGVLGKLVAMSILVSASACALEPIDDPSEQPTQDQDLAASNPDDAKADLGPDSLVPAASRDGVQPQNSPCWNDRRFVQSTHLFINGDGQSVDSIIYLYYSPSCRTTWARLTGGTIAVPNDNRGGSASINRNSDGRAFSCSVTTTSGECTTAMVNDANVTSFAFGFEDGGAWSAWARTGNF